MTNHQNSQCLDIRRIAVVGSGVAGLSAAILLEQKNHSVTVFEKSRGPGGRLAAKRVTGGSADIGAQYFTIRNPEFRTFLRKMQGMTVSAHGRGVLVFSIRMGIGRLFLLRHAMLAFQG